MKSASLMVAMFLFFIALFMKAARAEELAFQDMPDLSQDMEAVYSQDSADGESSKIIIALKKDARVIKQILNEAVGLDEIIELGKLFNNEQHNDDFVSEYRQGLEISRDAFPEILKAPLRSFKKAPRTFQVTLEQAADAYNNSPNHFSGSVRYTGIAVWAVVKGSYYLIIETPFMLFKNTLLTAVAIPFKITVQMAEIGVKFCYQVIKGLVFDLPRSFRYPMFMKESVEINKEKIENFKVLMSLLLKEHTFENREADVLFEIDENKGVFEVYTGIGEEKIKAFRVLTKIKPAAPNTEDKNMVVLKLEITRKYFRALKAELKNSGLERDEVRPAIEERMTKIISDIASTLL